MSQLDYQIDMTIGVEGGIADTTFGKDTISRVALADLRCARLLVRDATAPLGDRGAKIPTADFAGSGDVLGVLMWDPGKVNDGLISSVKVNFAAGDELPVLRRGRIYVKPEDAVVQGVQAFARFASGGGGTELGRFRSDADTATAAAVPSARWFTSTTAADQVAVLEINLPTTSAA